METQILYSEMLGSALTKLRSFLKKHKSVVGELDKALSDLSSDVSTDANKYFGVFKLAMESKHLKSIEVSLEAIQQLVSNGFLTGKSEDMVAEESRTLIDTITETVCACAHHQDDSVQIQLIKTLVVILTSSNCNVHDKSLTSGLLAFFHVHNFTKNPVISKMAKSSLSTVLQRVFYRANFFESSSTAVHKFLNYMVDNAVINTKTDDSSDIQNKLRNESSFGWCFECRNPASFVCEETNYPVCSEECDRKHKVMWKKPTWGDSCQFYDVLNVLGMLCELSTKESNTSEAYKSKLLSLELILSVLYTLNPLITSEKKFIELLKSQLCDSLIKNSLSFDTKTYTMSLSIFVVLVKYFKDNLKAEISMFMNEIFLKILESPSASYHQKVLVIEVFYRLTQDPRTTLELFLNYDCDMKEKDTFASMVDTLRKVVIGNSQGQLRMMALETLSSIISLQAASLLEEIEEGSCEETDNTSVDQFEKIKMLKTQIGTAVSKFNLKPMGGLQFLAESGHLNLNSPLEIATFIKTSPGISKTVAGEFIGANKPLNMQVLDSFASLFDFTGKSLLYALREFLLSFRIPGEGQVIDRIMEKFAEKYCSDNPEAFASPDSAFVLSFAIMMLQTNLHNPSVKDKMTAGQFCVMCSHDSSLPTSLLESIHHEVKENPFKLPEDDRHKKPFKEESQLIAQNTGSLLKKCSGVQSEYVVAKETDHIKTMFEVLWHPLLATFSIVLEDSSDQQFWKLSLDGMLSCIKVACRYSMHLELEAFISALVKFTALTDLKGHLTDKNIECIRALIATARSECNHLSSAWTHILKCLSVVDHLHMVSSGVHIGRRASPVELMSSESIKHCISASEIDHVFSLSKHLDNSVVVEFVTALIEVSKEELSQEHPRTFSLQALVNVADMNMDRMRFVWGQLWHRMKQHFAWAGTHEDRDIASFAVDSLKQLAIKFLKKDELVSFNFQRDFLQPFEAIMRRSRDLQVKELVIVCMEHLVLTTDRTIKSGWHSVFEVFNIAARQDVQELLFPTMRVIEDIIENSRVFCREMVGCLGILAGTSEDEISLRCVDLSYACCVSKDLAILVLSELASRVLDRRFEVREKALRTIYRILTEEEFEDEQWKMIFSVVVLPIFDDLLSGEKIAKEWVNSSCKEAVLVFCHILDKNIVVNEFWDMLASAALNMNETVANVCIKGFVKTVKEKNKELTEENWNKLSSIFNKLFEKTTPKELMENSIEDDVEFNIDYCIEKCIIQVHLIHSLSTVAKFAPDYFKLNVLESVDSAYLFAREFNRNIERRYSVWKAGFFSSIKTLPGLSKHELTGLKLLFSLEFSLVSHGYSAKDKMYTRFRELLWEVSSTENMRNERAKELEDLIPIISSDILPYIQAHFEESMKYIGEDVINLVTNKNAELRRALKPFLLQIMRAINNFESL